MSVVSVSVNEMMATKKPNQVEIILPGGERLYFTPRDCMSKREAQLQTWRYVAALEHQLGRTLVFRFAGEKMYRFTNTSSRKKTTEKRRGFSFKQAIMSFFDLD